MNGNNMEIPKRKFCTVQVLYDNSAAKRLAEGTVQVAIIPRVEESQCHVLHAEAEN